MTSPAEDRIPVHLLTGFLGSGKTTLLNRVLRAPGMEGTLVIVNEFGEVGLDHLLIETPEDETILLANGCLCCAMLGDLVVTLTRLILRIDAGEIPAVERIIIETTGLADPVPLLQTLEGDELISSRFALSGVVTVVDGVNGAANLEQHREALKQATVADRLVISKTDLAPGEVVAALGARLAEINPGVDIQTAQLADANIADLFRRSPGQHVSLAWLSARIAPHQQRGEHHGRHHHHDDNGIRSFSVRHEPPVSIDGLRLWLNALARYRGPQLLRMKGLINVEGAPVVVHAVQQVISEPQTLAAWPSDDPGVTDRLYHPGAGPGRSGGDAHGIVHPPCGGPRRRSELRDGKLWPLRRRAWHIRGAGAAGVTDTVLITGGTRGIGLATAKRLTSRGNAVIAIARRPAEDFPGIFIAADLSDRTATAEALEQVTSRFAIDGIVNCAGLNIPERVGEVDLDHLQQVLEVNVRATVQCTQAVLPGMIARGYGRIVNISSRGALGRPKRTSYSAAKAGIIGLTRTWALELAEKGITANVVSPGPTATEMFRRNNLRRSRSRGEPAPVPGRRADGPVRRAGRNCRRHRLLSQP